MLSFLTMSNVAGAGYQLKVVKHANGVMIEAGCFRGTADEFIANAEQNGFMKYVKWVNFAKDNM